MWIADGRHRHGVVVSDEQVSQEHQLGLGGVLELVEQDDAVAPPLGRSDVGVPGRERRGGGDLVGEVEGVSGALERGKAVDDRQQGPAVSQRGDHALEPRGQGAPAGRRGVGDRPEHAVELGHDVGRRQQVLGHLAREVDDGSNSRALGLGHLAEVTVVTGHRFGGVLPGCRLGQQSRIGLDPEP